jgi:hypothetical protein
LKAAVGVAIVVGTVILLGAICFYYVDSYQSSIEYKIITDVIRDVSKTGDQVTVIMGNGSCCESTYVFYTIESVDNTANIISLYKGDYVTILYKYNNATEESTFLYIKPVAINSRWG